MADTIKATVIMCVFITPSVIDIKMDRMDKAGLTTTANAAICSLNDKNEIPFISAIADYMKEQLKDKWLKPIIKVFNAKKFIF